MPRILELFKGTGSVGKVFEAHGWEVVSVDIEAKFKPTIIADVLDLPPTIGKGFDFIWFSPPCKNFSRALTRGPRDLEQPISSASAAPRRVRVAISSASAGPSGLVQAFRAALPLLASSSGHFERPSAAVRKQPSLRGHAAA